MAFTRVTLSNTQSGAIKYAPVGFSWTTFFFGPFPALFRGDFLAALVMLMSFLLVAIVTAPLAYGWITGLFGVWVAAIYNRSFIARRQENGWTMDGMDTTAIRYNGLMDKALTRTYGHELRNLLVIMAVYTVVAVLAVLVALGGTV